MANSLSQNPPLRFEQFAQAEWVVETGPEDILSSIYMEWYSSWRDKMSFERCSESCLRGYVQLEGRNLRLEAKCNFVRINDAVVCLLQPFGRYADTGIMKDIVLNACDIPIEARRERFSDSANFYNMINAIKNKSNLPSKRSLEKIANVTTQQKESFAQTDLVVNIEGDYNLNRFRRACNEKQLSWTHLSETVFTYATLSPDESTEYLPCMADLAVRRINNVLVSFIHAGNVLVDRTKLRAMIPTWCPQAKQVLSNEDLPDLLTMLFLSNSSNISSLLMERETSGLSIKKLALDTAL